MDSTTFKIFMIVAHVVFGVLGTVMAIFALGALKAGKTKLLIRFAAIEFLGTLASLIFGAIHYINAYQTDKPIILNGQFPLAHSLFMEVKEHFFIAFFLLSVYLQIRLITMDKIHFSDSTQKELKSVLSLLIILGLLISFMGLMVNMGLRVPQ